MFVNPKDENDVYVTRAVFHHSTDGGKTFTNVATPHGDNHVVWFNPDNPKIFIETNDGGANITQDAGAELVVAVQSADRARCTWSTPTSSFPYLVYGPQQDTGKNIAVPEPAADGMGTRTIRASCGFRRRDARAARCGRFRPARSSTATARASSGAMNIATGQEQEYWINPQQRYGKNPKDMIYRFVRQSPIEDRRAQSEHRLPRLAVRAQKHRRRRALDEVQPRRHRERPGRSRDVRRADHARHDR